MTAASSQTKRPGERANAPEPVSKANPAQEKTMNVHTHTPPARPVTSEAIHSEIESLYCDACAIVHQLRYLGDDMEDGFDFRRGKPCGANGITLGFQKDGIDAKLWLVAEAWKNASNLRDRLDSLKVAFDKANSEESAA